MGPFLLKVFLKFSEKLNKLNTHSFNSAQCDIVPHGDFDVGLVINSCGSIRRSRMRTIQLKFNLNAVMMRMMKLGP